MGEKRKRIDVTSAEKKSIGFDFQYYFFLWKLLCLQVGQSVGLEVKDDVHTDLNADEQILYQLKHTVQTTKAGVPSSLSESDYDLWKTWANWAKVITDTSDGRATETRQLAFIKKTTFVLASNKSSAGKNKILDHVILFQEGGCKIDVVKIAVQGLRDRSTDADLQGYIDTVFGLKAKVLKAFLLKVQFELDEDDIIGRCKQAILSDKVDLNRVDDVFSKLDSSIRADNFLEIKQGEKIQISFDNFYQKYRRHYELARSNRLPTVEFTGILPDNLEHQTFIRQLLEIQDMKTGDLEEVTERTRSKMKLQVNMNSWIESGELTQGELDAFEADVFARWKNKHQSAFRNFDDESMHNDRGFSVLSSMRELDLEIADQKLGIVMSNGKFYGLSDIPKIGWRMDWEKYKK